MASSRKLYAYQMHRWALDYRGVSKPNPIGDLNHTIKGHETDSENESNYYKNKTTINIMAFDPMARGYHTEILQIKKHKHIIFDMSFFCVYHSSV